MLFDGYDLDVIQVAAIVKSFEKSVGRRAAGTAFGGE